MKKNNRDRTNNRDRGNEVHRRLIDEALILSEVDRHPDQETPPPQIRRPQDGRVVFTEEGDDGSEAVLRLLSTQP